jgi:hypothetical protein
VTAATTLHAHMNPYDQATGRRGPLPMTPVASVRMASSPRWLTSYGPCSYLTPLRTDPWIGGIQVRLQALARSYHVVYCSMQSLQAAGHGLSC